MLVIPEHIHEALKLIDRQQKELDKYKEKIINELVEYLDKDNK